MPKTYIEIFSGDSLYDIKNEANSYAEEHDAEIVSSDLFIKGEAFIEYHLTVVFKEANI